MRILPLSLGLGIIPWSVTPNRRTGRQPASVRSSSAAARAAISGVERVTASKLEVRTLIVTVRAQIFSLFDGCVKRVLVHMHDAACGQRHGIVSGSTQAAERTLRFRHPSSPDPWWPGENLCRFYISIPPSRLYKSRRWKYVQNGNGGASICHMWGERHVSSNGLDGQTISPSLRGNATGS